MKILNIAQHNTAGCPYDFYRMFKFFKNDSRLVTMYDNKLNYPEDICLDLFFPNFRLAKNWRKHKVHGKTNRIKSGYFEPHNIAEDFFFILRDLYFKPRINRVINEYELNTYDIIVYHGGMDFLTNSHFAQQFKLAGKKIVICYYGSDLRARGIVRKMDELSDLNLTVEYDHLMVKKDLNYIFLPFFADELPERKKKNDNKIRVIHTPTNRIYKGTEIVLKAIEPLKRKYKNLEFILMENQPREKVLEAKATSDICIDQVGGRGGGTGYGKSGLESLFLGIPTITNMDENYQEWLEDNPFVIANNELELINKLDFLIKNKEERYRVGIHSKKWFLNHHSPAAVYDRIIKIFKMNKISL